ncbi:DUF5713 family protein [Candidatus Enterococcus ferrettii]|uniref:Uncharacterized protein n=1 Tax=Candidatus Enterococcus ferrettii TaxID=2815324 RepID=A0ABV0EWC4_9ENTE|nr:DUF5713 family protein [Enterococcus sp. 665A]MBO1340235.1 hypothetical protein [Enterococcus sp. 665A]
MKEINYLEDMYVDGYFPNFLVDKIRDYLKQVVQLIEGGTYTLETVQEALDNAIDKIFDLEDEFDEHDCSLETVARESIAETIMDILQYYEIDLDIETAFRKWYE